MLGGAGMKGFGGDGGEIPSVSLNLTALMDILSNLLFFLLAAYTVQSAEVKQKADLSLPVSSSQLSLKPSLTVLVSRTRIEVAGEPVVAVEGDKIAGTVEDDDRIVPLYDKLDQIRSARKAAGRDEGAESDVILLMADRDTDSSVITKVLKTAGTAGFVNVRFGVLPP
jgi:biopolymer transport protein ExbD